MKKKQISMRAAMVLIVVALVLGVEGAALVSGDNVFDQLNKYKDVLSLAQKYYVDDVDLQKLNEAAVNGLLSQLDPHSAYLPPRVNQQETEKFQGSYQGVGLEIININDTIVVSEPMGSRRRHASAFLPTTAL